MKRDSRISRALVSAVGITLTLALVFWAYNLGKSHGVATNPPPQPRTLAAIVDPALTAQSTLQTPTTISAAATSQPATPLLAATTQRSADGAGAQIAAAKQSGEIVEFKSSALSLADAKAKFDAGQLIDARRTLNAALASGALSDADAKSVKQLLSQINARVIFSREPFFGDEYSEEITVQPRSVLSKIANSHDLTADLLVRINKLKSANSIQAGKPLKVIKHGPFNAIVDKSDFRLELWLGDPGAKNSQYVTSFPVGLGKDDSTPNGVWAVGTKLKNPTYYSPRGEGIIAADDPKNPLGEAWIALTGTDGQAIGKTSYGIHGTIDPSSIGKRESMGCIRLLNEDVAQVYETLVDGKSIVVVRD